MRFPILEGFDHYAAVSGTAGALDSRWTRGFAAFGFVTGLGGTGQALNMGNAGNQASYQMLFPDSTHMTGHFAFELTTMTDPMPDIITLMTSTGGHQFTIAMTATGLFQVLGEANAVVATGSIAIIPNQIYRCCWRADMTTGTFAMSINGDNDPGLSVTGVDIQDDPTVNTCGLFRFHQFNGNFGVFDDIILGIDECVDWGPQQIDTCPADGDIAVTWTRSAGASNFANVNNIPFDVDTTYNSSSTVNQTDIFSYANPGSVPASILCVQQLTIARKEESAVRKIKEILRVGATDYPGDEHTLAETYGHWVSSWPTNPTTTVAWLPAALNALQGGYQLTEVD